jgi:large subunit ribosomal protein L19e
MVKRRIAASILKCGKRKVWFDPNEVLNISFAGTSK